MTNKKYEIQFAKLEGMATRYLLKKSLGAENIFGCEIDGYEKYNQYKHLIEMDIPEWFNGPCGYLENAIEFDKELSDWERKVLIRGAEKGYEFAHIHEADSFLRICRARKFLKEAIALYKELPSTKRFEKYEVKKLILELQKSIEKGEGVARSGAQILRNKITKQEMEATSTSISWNTVVKVPRMSSK